MDKPLLPQTKKRKKMSRTGKIICGAALLLFGIVWVLEITNVIDKFSYEGWWTIFIIVPFFVSLFTSKQKAGSIIGIGIGVLLLLSTRGIVEWYNFWKLILCLIAIVWGLTLIFNRKGPWSGSCPDKNAVKELKQIDQDGRHIRQINVSFGKQIFEFAGQRFEGADVQSNFGFVSIDLRNADLLDGAVIKVDCNFGGIEIRAGHDVIIKQAVNTSFAGVESHHEEIYTDNMKTIYINGKCCFGGIEVK